MASGKEKRKSRNASETTPKLSRSGKKTLKSLKSGSKVVRKSLNQNSGRGKEVKAPQSQARTEDERTKFESGNPESSKNERTGERKLNSPRGNQEKGVVTIASGKNKGKNGNPTETTAQLSSSGKKTPNSLKPKRVIVKKNKIKEGEQESNRSEREGEGEGEGNLNSPHGKKGNKFLNEKKDGKAEENVGGLILMCNAKTKPDCFRYQVMGVSTNQQQLVMGIKPGLKLFLFDFDVKLLYGIYEASSAGGMKLEPAAFGGGFPVQVRFKMLKDCLPLPLSVFKKAIKDIYDEKTRKFKTQLSAQQVKKLTALFQPASYLLPNAKSEPALYLLPNAQSSSFQEPLAEPNFCPPPIKPAQEAHKRRSNRDPYITSDYERKQFSEQPADPIGEKSSPPPLFLSEKEYRNYGLQGERQNNSTAPLGPNSDPYSPLRPDAFLTEKEYRTYGLRGRYEQPRPISPSRENNRSLDSYQRDPYDPYNDSTTSLVDRYLSLPKAVMAPSESYIGGYNNYVESGINHQGRLVPDGQKTLYSRYPSNGHPEYNENPSSGHPDYSERYHNLGGETEVKSAPVSARYSFAGPSVSFSYR